jgi:hypothetical protein
MLGDSVGIINRIPPTVRPEKHAIYCFMPVKTVALMGRIG